MNKCSTYAIFTLVFFCLFWTNIYAQNEFKGRVYDANNKEPLAFVNIIYNSSNLGTSTDINGNFEIGNKNNIEFLRVSYLGYNSKKIDYNEIEKISYIDIYLVPDAYYLDEVVVLPGENPAHRIIKEVKRNANINNPEKVSSFSFTQYSKMIFTFDIDDLKNHNDSIVLHDKSDSKDEIENNDTVKTGAERIKEFVESQHLFITESITERHFKYPDKNKEKVLAHRIAGLKSPNFSLLTSQFQSLSFYDDFISIMDKRYVNPISSGSTRRYFFNIEDTMYSERGDTVFVISFRPGRGRNFDGLRGVMHINSYNYAIQSVNARPYEPDGAMDVIIQQKYSLIDDKQWFPTQLNTEIIFNFMQGSADDVNIPMLGIGRSYISDINIGREFSRRDFDHIKIKINPDAHKQNEDFWNMYRASPLSQRDLNTYNVIDSIGEEINLDRVMEFVEIMSTGYISFKFLNIEPQKLSWYNEYEGYRLGFGAHTNHRLASWVSLGGYFAYGLRDKSWKYGFQTQFNLHRTSNTKLRFGFKEDLNYADKYMFNKRASVFSNDNIREFFYNELDPITKYYTGLKFNTLRYLSADILMTHTKTNHINKERYFYNFYNNRGTILNTEVGIYLRYAYKERFFQTPKGNRLSMGTDYPILYFNYIRGLPLLDGLNYDYSKYEAQIYKRIVTRWYGDTHITLTGALTRGDVPYSGYYYGEGTYSFYNVNNSFNAMRPHEFISERFANIHIKHDFGSLLFKTKNWQPRIAFTSSAGWGDAPNIKGAMLRDGKYQTMDKGYFESGMQINNIFVFNFTGLGLGVYYRYGAYSLNNEIDNFAFKLTTNIVL